MAVAQGGQFTRDFGGLNYGQEYVVFLEEQVHQPGASESAGRPIYMPVEFIEIRFPGDTSKIIYEKATDMHREIYSKQYEAFQKRGSGTLGIDGTPLEAWPSLNRTQVMELKAINIMTVEMLANVADVHLTKLGPGGLKWRERAKAFLLAAEDNAITDRIASENADLREQLAIQKGEMAKLGELLNGLTSQLQGLKAAGEQGIGPAHIAGLMGQTAATPTAKSALDSDDNYIAPRRGPGRPSNAEKAAREAGQTAA